MTNGKLISADFYGDFGFFKKPDINDTIFLTYNFIHKPVILGIFGAILGYGGHKKEGELPEYYEKLKDVKIGIQPIGENQKNGNFEKMLVKYNDTTGFSSNEKGGILNVLEQVLVKPAYRIFVLINEEDDVQENLRERLEKKEAVFVPYFGKNEFHCWWGNYKEYDFKEEIESKDFVIKTIFSKPQSRTIKDLKKTIAFNFSNGLSKVYEKPYIVFERLPVGFDTFLKQYSELQEFIYTNTVFEKQDIFEKENFYELGESKKEIGDVIYMF